MKYYCLWFDEHRLGIALLCETLRVACFHVVVRLRSVTRAWGLGIGDWGLGIGDWECQSIATAKVLRTLTDDKT
ncbi:MAG: hypothetical protein ACFKPT_04735 [Gloeotrichia echinulata GP01]